MALSWMKFQNLFASLFIRYKDPTPPFRRKVVAGPYPPIFCVGKEIRLCSAANWNLDANLNLAEANFCFSPNSCQLQHSWNASIPLPHVMISNSLSWGRIIDWWFSTSPLSCCFIKNGCPVGVILIQIRGQVAQGACVVNPNQFGRCKTLTGVQPPEPSLSITVRYIVPRCWNNCRAIDNLQLLGSLLAFSSQILASI